jgi:hypothetical protein
MERVRWFFAPILHPQARPELKYSNWRNWQSAFPEVFRVDTLDRHL